ncbi:hypothetical protein K0M31_020055, partial [Melipona bicolor]
IRSVHSDPQGSSLTVSNPLRRAWKWVCVARSISEETEGKRKKKRIANSVSSSFGATPRPCDRLYTVCGAELELENSTIREQSSGLVRERSERYSIRVGTRRVWKRHNYRRLIDDPWFPKGIAIDPIS